MLTGSQNNFLSHNIEKYRCKWDGVDPTYLKTNKDDVEFNNL